MYKDGYAEWVSIEKLEESHRKEDEIKRRVQNNLEWMRGKFLRVTFSKGYKGEDYLGIVKAVRWIRRHGYVVDVLYSDGYRENLQLRELEKVLLEEFAAPKATFENRGCENEEVCVKGRERQ